MDDQIEWINGMLEEYVYYYVVPNEDNKINTLDTTKIFYNLHQSLVTK